MAERSLQPDIYYQVTSLDPRSYSSGVLHEIAEARLSLH